VITKEKLDNAVFTLKSIISKHTEILYVIHDDDDEWQFLNGEKASLEDMMMVSLGQIMQLDDTITQILNLDIGYEANRTNLSSEWVIHKSKDAD